MKNSELNAQDKGPADRKPRRRVWGCLGLILSPILGFALGWLLASIVYSGWFTPWVTLASPPEKPVQILMVNEDNLWVKSDSGAVYAFLDDTACRPNCWQKVDTAPGVPSLGKDIRWRKVEPCVTPPPLLALDVRDRQGECVSHTWFDVSTVVALKGNGQLLTWHASSGSEYGPLIYPIFAVGGAAAFFVLALIVFFIQKAGAAQAARNRSN